MHFMAVSSMNCHEVADLQASGNVPLMQGALQCIGFSLKASLHLFNHRCVHSVLRFNCERATIFIVWNYDQATYLFNKISLFYFHRSQIVTTVLILKALKRRGRKTWQQIIILAPGCFKKVHFLAVLTKNKSGFLGHFLLPGISGGIF